MLRVINYFGVTAMKINRGNCVVWTQNKWKSLTGFDEMKKDYDFRKTVTYPPKINRY